MLEVFDALGVVPHRMAGSSIGAIMGMLYASGLSGQEIKAIIDRLTVSRDESWFDALFLGEDSPWIAYFDPTGDRGGLIEADAFIDFLRQETGCERFEDLEIPLRVVATDFWKREQVVYESGELFAPLRASFAVPGLFVPVSHQGRVLVDGGLSNPVPYDLLLQDCDITVAIDVLGTRTPPASALPSYFDTTFNAFQIMQASIMHEKLKRVEPDIYIRPEIRDVRLLEFDRVDEILRQASPAQEALERALRSALGR
jgi:NTE family protein